jgi:hypothetical protein
MSAYPLDQRHRDLRLLAQRGGEADLRGCCRMARRHAAFPSRISVARAFPASLRCNRLDEFRSRTTRKRRAGRCCNPVVEVRAPPLPLGVVALVLEPDRDAVAGEAPEVLLKPVVELARPLAPEEVLYRLASLEELFPVTPLRVWRVRQRHPLGVAGVLGVLGCFDLLPRTLLGERGQWRSGLPFLACSLHAVDPSLLPCVRRGQHPRTTLTARQPS